MRTRAAGVGLLVERLQHRLRLLGVGAGVGVPGLGAELLVQRLADHVEDRLFGRAHRALRVTEDLPGDQFSLVQQLIGRDNLHD